MLDAIRDPDLITGLGVWAFALVALAVAVDSLVPLVPSEVVVVAGAAAAANAALDVRLLVVAVIVGGVAGDLASWTLGRAGAARARRLLTATPRRQAVLARVERIVTTRRAAAVIGGRFVPGGRTAVGLLAGVTRQPLRGYLGAATIGVSLWTVYLVGVGYVAGKSAGDPLVAVGVGVAAALIVSSALSWRRGAATAGPPVPAAPVGVSPVVSSGSNTGGGGGGAAGCARSHWSLSVPSSQESRKRASSQAIHIVRSGHGQSQPNTGRPSSYRYAT